MRSGPAAGRAAMNLHRRPHIETAPTGAPELRILRTYDLLGEVGRGSSGVVYEGHDTVLLRRVAIKIPSACPRRTTTTAPRSWSDS